MERESAIPIPTATLFLILLLVARLSWAANPTLLTIRDDVDTSGLAPCKAAKIGRGASINDVTQIFHNIGPPPPCHCLLSYSSIQSSTIRTTPSHLVRDIIYGWMVKKVAFFYLLQAGERNSFTSFSYNLGPTF